MTLPLERPIFLREYSVRTYSATAYLIAKSVVEFPYELLKASWCLVIYFVLVKLKGGFIILTASFYLLTLASISLGLLLGACIDDTSSI